MTKALSILKTSKSVTERAVRFASSIQRDLQVKILDTLKKEKETIEDKIFELSDLSLTTDFNRGLKQATQEECEARFEQLIELEYQLELLKMKLKIKQAAFDKYFGEDSDVKTAE